MLSFIWRTELAAKSTGRQRVLRFRHACKKGGLAYDICGRPLGGGIVLWHFWMILGNDIGLFLAAMLDLGMKIYCEKGKCEGEFRGMALKT